MTISRYIYVYVLYICSVFINIASTSALAKNFKSSWALEPEPHQYHETPLHNLQDIADLGVESSGSKSDKFNELKEILEDESQSPDEQSVSKYEENVKVFENPVVLEETSHPTDDEVKDFEKVKDHEKASEDNHFDSLTSLLKESSLFKLTKNLFNNKEKNSNSENNNNNLNNNESNNSNSENDSENNSEKNDNNKPVADTDYVEKNRLNLSHLANKLPGFNSGNGLGFNQGNQPNLLNPNAHNPLANVLNPDVLKNIKLPPVTVNAQSRNNFHVFNVHHHHHKGPVELDFKLHEVSPQVPGGYVTKECFEGSFNGEGPGKRCYCSKNETCKCTKTFMMLVSVCDTLLNDSDLREFCSYNNVKDDHPNLNHRFSKGMDKFVWDAFKTVQSSLCNSQSLEFCEGVVKMEKLCLCAKCD